MKVKWEEGESRSSVSRAMIGTRHRRQLYSALEPGDLCELFAWLSTSSKVRQCCLVTVVKPLLNMYVEVMMSDGSIRTVQSNELTKVE